jgi:hypothetical protein
MLKIARKTREKAVAARAQTWMKLTTMMTKWTTTILQNFGIDQLDSEHIF